jgi:23S rRNA (guanosine2251-2'-O)-methyltransferase
MICFSGFHAIEERIRSGKPCEVLLVAKPGPRARELVELARQHRIAVSRVGTDELDRLAPDHRGIVLEADEAGAESDVTLDSFLAGLESAEQEDALVVILDEVTDPHNYGAILRSCDQFGVDLVVARRRRNAKHAEVIANTSAGAADWVAQAEEPNLSRAVERLKEAGFWIYGADMGGDTIWKRDLRGKTALILGGEAGLSRLLKEQCDATIAIPCLGRIDSLNVSVATGVILYEAVRQRSRRS